MKGKALRPSARNITAARLATILACACSSCSTPPAQQEVSPGDQRGTLGKGEAARVGDQVVTIDQVAALSNAQNISPEQARSMLVFDALMAAGARDRGYHTHDDVVIRHRSTLARALLERMKRDAEAKPISDDEVREFTDLHWLDMDRPAARRTTHAVVMPDDPKNEEQAAKADELAGRIAEAVSSATDASTFKTKAGAVDAKGMKVTIQDLPPVVEDGRVADLDNRPPPGVPPQTFAPSYVKAVFALAKVGEKSKPFRSPFGTHVAMLVGIQPAVHLPFEKRRALLAEEVRTRRVSKELDALNATLRAKTSLTVERNANSLLQLIAEEHTERGP